MMDETYWRGEIQALSDGLKINGADIYEHTLKRCAEIWTSKYPELVDFTGREEWIANFWTKDRLPRLQDHILKSRMIALNGTKSEDMDEFNLNFNRLFNKISSDLLVDFFNAYKKTGAKTAPVETQQTQQSTQNTNNQNSTDMAQNETFAANMTAAQIETINANRKFFKDALNAVKNDELEWSIEGNKIVLYAKDSETTFTYTTTNRKRTQWTDASLPNAAGKPTAVRVYWQTPARAAIALAGFENVNIWTKHITDECFESICQRFPHLADALRAARNSAEGAWKTQSEASVPSEESAPTPMPSAESEEMPEEMPQDFPQDDAEDAECEEVPSEESADEQTDEQTQEEQKEEQTADAKPQAPKANNKIRHKEFEKILKLVKLGFPVYLWGPAGTGKSEIARMVAEELGLEFYFSNCLTEEYKFEGFNDANGRYLETQFYQAFTKGGIFFLDEFDVSAPSVAKALNAATGSRYFNFPNGRAYAHPNFRFIAAGNTIGTGSTSQYVANNMDASTRNRFRKVFIDYDHNIEMALANGNVSLVQFVEDVRQAVKACEFDHIISYRNTDALAKLETEFSRREAIELAITETLDRDDVKMLCNHLQADRNVYVKELRYIASAI